MSKITLNTEVAAEIETPPSGQVTLFYDDSDKKFKVKLDTGVIKEIIYAGVNAPVDKDYSQSFTNASTVSVTHNLGKIPSVVILNTSTGKRIYGEVVYDILDITNKLTVNFNEPLTGQVVCN